MYNNKIKTHTFACNLSKLTTSIVPKKTYSLNKAGFFISFFEQITLNRLLPVSSKLGYASASSVKGITDTKDLLLRLLRKTTSPSINANSV